MDARFEATRQEAATLDKEREEMEATLHEVAADLGRLALLYRSQGKAQHAVPPRMTSPDLARPRPASPGLARPRPTSPDLARPRPA